MTYIKLALVALLVVSTVGAQHAATAGTEMSKAAEVAAAVAASPPEDPPSTGSGIYCYKCNSFKEPDCMSEETLNKKYIVECKDKDGQKSIGCWNIRQWVEYDQDSVLKQHERVIRQCAYHRQENTCIYRSGFGGMVNQCFCNSTVACNTATTATRSVALTLLVSLFSLLAILKNF